MRGFELDVELLDVQTLNDGLFGGRYDIAKASFHAALLLADRFVVLASGAALGFGVGPLLVSGAPGTTPSPESRVLCPGATTTATLLYHCLHPHQRTIDPRRLHRHRTRAASWRRRPRRAHPRGPAHLPRDGLTLVEDLGTSFEGWRARRCRSAGRGRLDLPEGTAERFTAVLRESIAYARPIATTRWSRSGAMPRSWARTSSGRTWRCT